MPFHGRTAELAELAGWRNDPAPLAALLVHGPAGCGKTRLVTKVEADWDDEKRLVVIDDADRWAWPDLFAKLQESMRSGPQRVLLTSRTTGWWWSSTRQRVADLDYVMGDLELSPSLDNRKRSFTLACRAFARALNAGHVGEEPPAIADETVHDLHMAALTAVHGDPTDVNRTQLVRQLKARDTGTPADKLAEDYLAVAPPDDPDPDLLVRAATRWPQLLPKVDELFTGKGAELADQVDISTLRTLAATAGLPPLEQVARRVFPDERFALDALPAMITKRLVDNNLRHSEDWLEQAEMWGNLSARTALAGLREEAADASQREVDAYRELAAQDPENRPLLADAMGDLGLRLIALGRTDEVIKVSEEAIELWKQIATDDPETMPQLASALEQISYRYSALGKREEAMDAISRSAVMFQELAQLYPALFRVDFARVAGALARRLYLVGRRDEAADAMHWSLVNWREIARDDPRYEPELARNLAACGGMIADFGRPERAAEAVEESIVVFRRLTAANPEFTRELADALLRHSQLLDGLGRYDEAPFAAQESVVLWRKLAVDAAGRAGLAAALLNLVDVAGDRAVERAAAAESVELYRELARTNPVHHQVNLARALAAHSEQLVVTGKAVDEHVREMLDLCARLPLQLVMAFGADLAMSLHSLGRALSQLDHHDLSIAVIEQVVDIWRTTAPRNQSGPLAYILALQQLSLNLRAAERFDESRNTAHLAVVLWHMALPQSELDTHAAYADTLAVYGRLCAETKHDLDNALVLAHRAVLITRDIGGEPDKLELALAAVDAVIDAFDDRHAAQKRLEELVSSSSAASA